jgi:hypothetical protein
MRLADVLHGKDGYILRVREVPAWAWALDSVNEALISGWCSLTRGWGCPLCLCARLGWTFAIGWGRDADGLRRHSPGGFLFALGQRGGLFSHRRGRVAYERLLTWEEACGHFPDCRLPCDDDGVNWVKGVLVSAGVPGDATPDGLRRYISQRLLAP